jgi:hypothetical protein
VEHLEKEQLEQLKQQMRNMGHIFEDDFTIEDIMTDKFIAMVREIRRRKALDENCTFKTNIRRDYND